MVKRLSTMRETWVPSLVREDPLEKEKATHSSTIAWRIPWTEEPGGLRSIGLQTVGHNQSYLAHMHAKHKRQSHLYGAMSAGKG